MEQRTQVAFRCIDPTQRDIPTPVEKIVSGRNYVSWGRDNHYTRFLYELYQNSALLGSIINSITDYVLGNGIISNLPLQQINEDNDTLSDIVKRCVTDYETFGAFAIQVLRNQLGEISELYWLDMRKIRLNEDKDKIYYSDFDHTKPRRSGSNKVIEYERFNPKMRQPNSIFYVTNKTDRDIYPVPVWSGAINDVVTNIEISKFHLHSILNNFAPSAIVNFNSGIPSEEEQKDIEEALNRKFSGSENASKMMLTWNESKENAVTIERLSEDNFDQKYQALNESTFKNIFTAFRMHPSLAGHFVENSGFNTQEFTEQFAIFNKTVIQPIQDQIERAFDTLFGEGSIKFDPFTVSEVNKDSEENQ